jgi:hypothetical protein
MVGDLVGAALEMVAAGLDVLSHSVGHSDESADDEVQPEADSSDAQE